MGKGKGKAGRKEAKLAAKKLNQAPKIPGMPKPAQPQKKAKKIPSREKKSALNTNPPGPATYPLPMGRPKPALRDRQNLGVLGSNFEPLAAQPEKNAVEPGYNPTEKGTLDQNSESVIGDENSGESDASDGSESEGEHDAVAQNTDFVTLNGAKHPRAAPLENSVSEARAGVHEAIPSRRKEMTEVEPNPYFVVDVEPTPVVLDTPASGDPNKKSRKQTEAEATELRKAAKEARKQTCTAPEAAASAPSAPPMEAAPPADSEVDFNALEAKLQAEIAAGTKAQEEAEASEKMLKKKRRRSSNGDEEVGEKKAKIEKLEKKKRKAEQGESVSEKKAKEKKGKKRKAEETAEVVEAEEASKKKRKHKDSA
ncbi:hypothetical protein BUE80_DR012061 [Diplocarpon rosae]|nr:hypothetical protein BUE80_DR012061 [Diplocarpon rosae]